MARFARCVLAERSPHVCVGDDEEANLERALHAFETGTQTSPEDRDLLRAFVSGHNARRLQLADRSSWPRAELQQMAARLSPQTELLPPPTPCEYVEEAIAWSCFGSHSRREAWLGHGYFFRQRPGDEEPLDNAAGSAMGDYDVLEDGFVRLRGASVLAADCAQLRADYPALQGLDDAEVGSWLVEQCGYLSAGQLRRLQAGGDHHELLGLHRPGELERLVDAGAPRKAALRLRSGGRAATFFVDGRYSISAEGLQAQMLDVKGVGTHIDALVSSPKTTGLLNLTDALTEVCYQRLVQRIAELEGATWSTVRYYAILDTGLQYRSTNPATGWEDERCVLLVRQPQSRLLDDYDGFNFSGVAPADVLGTGTGRMMIEALQKYGVSAEFVPSALFQSGSVSLQGEWNLQVDAPCTHLMDFSDFYVLPNSPLPSAWGMSEGALADALALERPYVSKHLLEMRGWWRLFGTDTLDDTIAHLEKRRIQLSKIPRHRNAASMVTADGVILPCKPKFCMCWFMELCDSEVVLWAAAEADRLCRSLLSGKSATSGVFSQVDVWLPPSGVNS